MIYIGGDGNGEIRIVGNVFVPPRWWQRILMRMGLLRHGIRVTAGSKVIIENCTING